MPQNNALKLQTYLHILHSIGTNKQKKQTMLGEVQRKTPQSPFLVMSRTKRPSKEHLAAATP